MSVNPISPDVFQGGQMTDLPAFTGTLDGTEVMEIVAAPAGQTNEASGVNYQITTLLLAQLIGLVGISGVIISQGEHATPGDPYLVPTGVSRVYVNKPIAEPTYVQLDNAAGYFFEPIVKDIAGTADNSGANYIHVDFTGGESADGNVTVPIGTPYGGYIFRPIGSLNTWTLGSA